MIFPYPQFLIEASSQNQQSPSVWENPGSTRILPFEPHWSDPNAPSPALGVNMAETRENSIY